VVSLLSIISCSINSIFSIWFKINITEDIDIVKKEEFIPEEKLKKE
jgi:hypothetical protein